MCPMLTYIGSEIQCECMDVESNQRKTQKQKFREKKGK